MTNENWYAINNRNQNKPNLEEMLLLLPSDLADLAIRNVVQV